MYKAMLLILSLIFSIGISHSGNASDLDEHLRNAQREGRVVMVELGSVGCIPCEQMKPVMSKLTETYKGKLDVIFIDVKKDHDSARRYGVYMIPVQVFLDTKGKEFHRHVGFYPYEEIMAMLKKAGM